MQCCGVYNSSDFADATKFNKTNPWWNPSMNATWQNFTVPITCCNVGNVFQSNWNSLPSNQLEASADCAVSGIGIYQTVSLFQWIIRK